MKSAHRTIGCAITVHRLLGPGFQGERIYQQALCLELNEQGFASSARRLSPFPTSNGDIAGHRVDLIVEERVLIELKAVPRIAKLHQQQVVSYLKATNLRLGF